VGVGFARLMEAQFRPPLMKKILLLLGICALALPSDGATVSHRYSFSNDLTDSAGGNTGILQGGASVSATHLILPGGGSGPTADAMLFTSPVDIGGNFGGTGVTVETWYTDDGSGTWAKLFTFGTSAAGPEFAYTNSRANTSRAGLDRNGNTDLRLRPTLNDEHHLVISVAADGTTNLWIDGTQHLTNIATNAVSNIVSTHEAIGATAWGDPGHNGTVNEFRIWDGPLTDAEVQANLASGPDAIPVPGDDDGDGLSNAWETVNGLDPNSSLGDDGAAGDPDGDGRSNLDEFNDLTDPQDPDTDGDGSDDGMEATNGTDPKDDDSDDDGLLDGVETNTGTFVSATDTGSDPLDPDSDGDFLTDGEEVGGGLDPNDPLGDNGTDGDPDGDTVSNFDEILNGTNPQNSDTDGDGLSDGVETNFGVYTDSNDTGTDPTKADTDGDGLSDGVENPNLPFIDINQPGTDPNFADTDFDFFPDGTEISLGSDPTDPNSTPAPQAAAIAHRYSFNIDGQAEDSEGGKDGVLNAGATVSGGFLQLPGTGAGPTANRMNFASPIDIGGNFGGTGVTVESWYADNNSGTWSKLFTFGTNAVGPEFAYTNLRGNTGFAGVDRNGNHDLPLRPATEVEHHLVISVGPTGNLNTWIDGVQHHLDIPTNAPSNIITTHEAIGATAWGDPGHNGTVNEFRIWAGEFTSNEVDTNAALGPDLLPDNTGGGGPVLFDVELNAAQDTGTLHFTGLEIGRTYHVVGSDNGQAFVAVPGSQFTATAESESINVPVDSAANPKVIVKGEVGPIP
jgi:hypothetical protein